MKKFVFSAAALTLTGTAVANDDWAQLDQDIQALSASVQGLEDGGMQIGGRVRTLYQFTDGFPDELSDLNDLGGFSVRNARLYASGTTAGDIGYRVEVDFGAGGTAPLLQAIDAAGSGFLEPGTNSQIGLLDAYLDIPVSGEFSARVGQFRAYVSREALIDSGNLFFVERSMIGNHFSGRSQGVALSGDLGGFDVAVTVQNGGDGVADELFYAVRGSFDMMGGGTDLIEGAYGAGEEMDASAAVAYFSDENTEDADGFLVEASLATSQFSAQASVLSFGDALSASNIDNESLLPSLGIEADTTPFSLQGTFMLSEASSEYGAWELGLRFQDYDNSDDTSVIDVGANYYANGHDFKYIINWTSIDSDSFDGDLISLGVNARF